MPDKVVQVPGLGNVSFPGTMSDDEIAGHIRDQISASQPQQPNPETFGQGFRSTLPIGGTGFGPMARIRDAVGSTLGQLSSIKDAYDKATDAFSKGYYIEAAGHLGGLIPFLGTAAHHIGETLGGTPAQYDKYGNIVKPGLQPNLAGATGEALGLALPAALDVAPEASRTIGNAASAAKAALSKPGTGKIALGTGEMLAGGAAIAHGNLFGIYPAARGVKTIGKGLAERSAAAGAAADAEIEQFAPGFSKMSEKDQVITRMVYDRIKNGPPPATPPPGPVQGPLVPPSTSSGRTIGDIAREELTPKAQPAPVAPTVPQAAPPAPVAPVPPEAPPQATVKPPTAQEKAIAGNRALRSANAETLSQAFNDAGVSSDDLRKLRVFRWPEAAKNVGVDFPVTHEARLKLMRDTIGALEQKEAAAPAARSAAPIEIPAPQPEEPISTSTPRQLELWQKTRAEAGVGEPPIIPNPPRPLQKLYGPNWQNRPDIAEIKRGFNAATSARNRALKLHKQYVDRSNAHLAAVKNALTAGKPVPPDVLADYPSLSE